MEQHSEESEFRQGVKTVTMLGILLNHIPDRPLKECVEGQLHSMLMLSAVDFGFEATKMFREYQQFVGQLDLPSTEQTLSLTGKTKSVWLEVFNRNAPSIQKAIDDRSTLWALPNEVWDYIAGMSSLSREEWQALPERIENILNTEFNCPSCKTALSHRQMIDISAGPASPQGRVKEGRTYLGKENPDKLHFNCPACKVQFSWSIRTGQTMIDRPQIGKGAGCMTALFAIFRSTW